MLDPTEFTPRLRAFYRELRDALHAHVSRSAIAEMSAASRYEGGDTIYALDLESEEILLRFCESWGRQTPFLLVCEGLPGGRRLFGTNDVSSAQFVLICDPIDGTRPLMYDKRSAWLLLGVAPNVEQPNLGDIEIALQGELPASKGGWADEFWAVKGQGARGQSANLYTGHTRVVEARPSGAASIEGGFAMLSKFFVGSKGWLAGLEEALIAEVLGAPVGASPQTFDDQYISTGGQFYELFSGRDRFNADLRPLAHRRLGHAAPLLCAHPYDCCTALIAAEAGALITDGNGQALRAPLDVETPVTWIGYANATIRAQIEPVLLRLLEEARRNPALGGNRETFEI